MLLRYIFILLLFIASWGNTMAQEDTWVASPAKFKGTYADGYARSYHSYLLGSVGAPERLCEGDTAKLSLEYTGTFIGRYEWYNVNNKGVILSDSSVFVINNVSVKHRGSYYCILRDITSGRTIHSDTIELRVKKKPVVRVTPDSPHTMCYGDTIALEASQSENDKEPDDTYFYSWTGFQIVGSLSKPDILINPTGATVYNVVVDNDGCRTSASIEIEICKPLAKLPDVVYLTQGKTLDIQAEVSATAKLQWYIGDKPVSTANPLRYEGLNTTSLVRLRVEEQGCITENSVDVYLKQGRGYRGGFSDGSDRSGHRYKVNPVVYTKSVCQSAEARFSVDYEGTFVCRYQWRKIGDDAILGDSSVFVIPRADISDRGRYYCILSDLSKGTMISSDTVLLQVKKLPVALIGSPESPKLACLGDSVVLNAMASENGKETGDIYSYSWSGSNFLTDKLAAIVKILPKTSMTYTVEVSNDGCTGTADIEIIVNKPEVDIPDYLYISEGNTLVLKADVPAAAKLIWSADGNVFENINPFEYPDIRKTMEVSVKMINEGCVAEDMCRVYVKRGRGYKGGEQDGFDRSCNPPEIISQSKAKASCVNSDAWLEVAAEGSSIHYLWQKFNNDANKFEAFVPAEDSHAIGLGTGRLEFTPLVMDDNGVYLCKLQNECGEVVSDTFSLSVGGIPIFKSRLNKEWDQCIDGNDSTHLNIVAIDPLDESLTYSWFKVNTEKHTYTPLPEGVSDYNKPYLKLLLNNKAKHEAVYLVNVENRCGRARDSVFIPVNTPIVIVPGNNFTRKMTACAGQNAEFGIATTGGGKVQYKLMKITCLISEFPLRYEAEYVKGGSSKLTLNGVTKADEGNYVWEVDNGCGQDTSDLIALRIETPPVVTASSGDTTLCLGQKMILSCRAEAGFSTLTYEWLKNGQTTGVRLPDYTIAKVSKTDNGNYVCRVSNSCPAVESRMIKVEIKEKPVIFDRPYIRSSYCEGDSLKLKVEFAASADISKIHWYHQNSEIADISGRISGSSSNTLSISSILESDAGGYKLMVVNGCGANFSEEVKLVVDMPARFVTDLSGYTDLVLCDGANQALSVATSGSTPIRYIWTHNAKAIADGFSGTIQLKNVKADTAGQYCCEIQNRCGGEVACASIKVSHPDTFRFELNSATNQVCAGSKEGATAVLMGSDTNTLYYLYKGAGVLVTKIHGRNILPNGGFIEFRGLMGGTYYVVGEDTKYTKGCTYRMPGDVIIQEHPQPLSFNVFIKKPFCKGGSQASVGLTGSEKDLQLEYTLWKSDGTEWKPYLEKIKGTGEAITWDNIPEGRYKVSAKNKLTGCETEMTGIVDVVEQDIPLSYSLFSVGNDSIYCAGSASNVVLQLAGKESEIKYGLQKDGSPYGNMSYGNRWEGVEGGSYTVVAENKWGCRNQMGRQQVIVQQRPASVKVSGGFVYCKEQTGKGRIEINDTKRGTRYLLYRESPKTLQLDTMGIGAPMVLEVPLEDKRYYVIARDTTAEGCETALSDTAVFRRSTLVVAGNPAEQYIPNGTSCGLSVITTGQIGTATYSWRPTDKLQDGNQTLVAPQTRMLTQREDFIVEVKDESNCIATATVSVVMTGGELACDIRKVDKVTAPDTIHACMGADIDLYGWVDAGAGNYQFLWRDENGKQSTEQYLRGYSRLNAGWIVLEVRSGENIKKDSVWINTHTAPEPYLLTPSGLLCAQKNRPVTLQLSGSQAGVRYILSYSTDDNRYNEMDTIPDGSSAVSFTIPDAYNKEGYYQVRSERTNQFVTCKTPMEGIVEIRKGNDRYAISGDKVYCESDADIDTIRINGRQTGVVYTLYRQSGPEVAYLPESGLLFTGEFGTGAYFVTATNGICIDTMPGRVHIVKNPQPEPLSLPEAGGYCNASCPSGFTITQAKAGITYTLYRKNFGLTDALVEEMTGVGKIVFGKRCEPGEYYIVAQNDQTRCSRTLTGSVKIAAELVNVAVATNGKYCDSKSSFSGGLKIASPQDGTDYHLYTAEGSYVGLFDSLAADGLYFHKSLQAGEYKVTARTSSCNLDMTPGIKIEKTGIPITNKIIAPYTLCQGDGDLVMKVSSTSGYRYELYRDSAGVVTLVGAKAGNGAILNFGSFNKTGTYEVVVRHPDLGCEWRIADKYHIGKALNQFNITGDTLYCAVDGGVVIGIDGTDRDVKYVLQKWNSLFADYQDVDELMGKGLPVAFKGYFPTGEYRINAVRGCEKVMNGLLNVTGKEMPSDSTIVRLEGNGCVDSSIIIRLEKAEPSVTYTLFHNTDKIGESLSGTGLKWKISPAEKGNYFVTADKQNCQVSLPQTIEIGERPTMSGLKGDTLLCANLYGELYIETWDDEATYRLFDRKGELISTGLESGGKLWFPSVPVGTFYPAASNGNCVVRGGKYTIDAIPVVQPEADQIKVSECVKRGEGSIEITDMTDTLHYLLSASNGTILLDGKGMPGDTLFTGLGFDRYCISIYNEKSRCRSDEYCMEIKEGASADSLTGDFNYCAGEGGAVLRLSGSERGMVYRMLTEEGNPMEEIGNGATAFLKRYKKGTYLFQKERTGFTGGCSVTDTIRIDSFPRPATHIALEVSGGGAVLCAGGDYGVKLINSQAGFRYILVKDAGAMTQLFMDTVAGTNGPADFPKKVNETGFYKVYAEAEGGACGSFIDTVFRLKALPRPIIAEGCSFCASGGAEDNCSIQISGLAGDVSYILYGGHTADTLYGPNRGAFRANHAGRYAILAKELPVGCQDTVARVEIKSLQKPVLFKVISVCAPAGEIKTDGAQGDSVSYWLYRNGVPIAGPVKRTTQPGISFGSYSEYGIYKIKAIGANGCEQWMRDSATLYEPLTDFALTSEGHYCNESTTGVTIRHTGSNKGWSYFLKKGPWLTDTLPGNGSALTWTTIAGKQVLSKGKYDLYAYNACETRLLKSIEIKESPLPAIFRLTGNDMTVCSGKGIDIILAGSQTGVTYQLIFNSGREQELTRKAGSGWQVGFGEFAAIGQYIVYGVVDSSGCRTKMDEKMFYSGSTPSVKKINGADVCMDGVTDASVSLSVTAPLQSGVHYFLLRKDELGDMRVDTILADATNLNFEIQHDKGCYYVMAQDIVSGCDGMMNGQYCIGMPLSTYPMSNAGASVELCAGQKYAIALDSSDIGVKYILQKDGSDYGTSVMGTGSAMEVGYALESGDYKIKAFTGACNRLMEGRVKVVVNPLPGMFLQQEYSYCNQGPGVVIGVKKPTYAEFEYRLYAPAGQLLDTKQGSDASTGNAGFDFEGRHLAGGFYRVEVQNLQSCIRTDSTKVNVNPLPTPFFLHSSGGEWICPNSTVDVYIDGSESGVEYTLYKKMGTGIPDRLIGRKFGTGKRLTIATVPEAGEYYVTAKNIETNCSGNMYRNLVLQQALPLQIYDLRGIQTGYCYTDRQGGSLSLENSQTGVVYELYRDALPAGYPQWGNGRELLWSGLAGKACSNKAGINDAGAIYEITARDTLTGCEARMKGKVGIIEESDPQLLAWHPNKDILRCQGQPVDFSLSASGCNLKYQWKKEGVSIKDTTEGFFNIKEVTSSHFGTYTCEIVNSCGMITMPAVNLRVRDSLVYLKRLEDKAVCTNSGQDVLLTGMILNGTSHEWFLAGKESDVKSYDSWYRIRNVGVSHAGTYVYRTANECGSLSDTMVLKVDGEPQSETILFRTDTICRGTNYLLHVESPDQVRWFRDGVPTGIVGKDLILHPATTIDEGLYTVRISNACGEKIAEVARLYVDDTIKILSLRPSEVVCEKTMVDLYIRTAPEKRVAYTWEHAGVVVARNRNSLRIGPMSADEPEYTYWINYRNKCTDSRSAIRLTVSDKLEYKDPVSVTACAEEGRDTILFIEHPATLIAGYQWYYQEMKEGISPVRMEGETTDTLHLALKTANTGYYYCEISRVCNPLTTNSSWFRVDSMPLVLSSLKADTLCEGSDLTLLLSGSGGSVIYDWMIRYRDGRTEQLGSTTEVPYSSEGKLTIPSVTMAHDSSLIWCFLHNDCGEAYSDTMLLRMQTYRHALVNTDTLWLCGNDTGRVEVRLQNGVLPWEFHYTTPGGKTVEVKDIRDTVSVLKLWQKGDYTLTYIKDSLSCGQRDGLPSVHVASPATSVVSLSGGGDFCAGETISLQLQIESEGRGPWKLWLRDEYRGTLPFPVPLTVSRKDTVLSIMALDSAWYYVDKVEEEGVSCEGVTIGKAAIRVHMPDIIDFALSGNLHVGGCDDLDLCKKLNPVLRSDGSPVQRENLFYINNNKNPLRTCTLSKERLMNLSGALTVRCEYTDIHDCPVTSNEVGLFVDPLPSAEMEMEEHACGNMLTKYEVLLHGAPKFTLQLERQLFKFSKYNVAAEVRNWQPVLGEKDTVCNGEIVWNSSDSCMTLKVLSVTDRHGCAVTIPENVLPSGTIYHHPYPEVEIWTRYPNRGNGWSKGETNLNISRGDSVGVKAILTQGDRPWNLVCSPRGSIHNIYGRDTVFALDTGHYQLTADHDHCGIPANHEWLNINYRNTGFVKLKALLDGPFNLQMGVMQTGIEDQLPLYGITELPDHSKMDGHDIIDWIEVELRSGLNRDSVAKMGNGTVVITRDTCLLWADGTITDRLGDSLIALRNACTAGNNQYYIVLHHRNHLAVMSALPCPISHTREGKIAKVDFTNAANVYRSTRYPDMKNHMTPLSYYGKEFWTMSAGDMNNNALVSVFDPNEINLRTLKPTPDGKSGIPTPVSTERYHLFDVNFDGEVDWPGWNKTNSSTLDWDKVRRNRYKFTEIK